MKKLLVLVFLGLVALGASAEAGKRIITDLDVDDTIADAAIDTTSVYALDERLIWVSDGAGDNDGAPLAWLLCSFTAASTDSFSVFIDYYLGGVAATSFTTQTSFVARTSAAQFSIPLDPTYMPEGIRVRFSNADVTGTAATTQAEAVLVQIVDRK